MLDDLKVIHEKDPQDALGVAEKQWQQLGQTYEASFSPKSEIANAVVAGMGGSALAADVSKVWPGLSVPLEVVRSYDVPGYVGQQTLFVASSYSGNTEETLSALEKAEEKGAQIAVIAAGGKLAEIARQKNYALFSLPANMQPRMAVFSNLAALVQLFSQAKLTGQNAPAELADCANWLKEQSSKWLPIIPAEHNQAKKIALELMGKSVVIYSGTSLYPAAYKWKININENAKHIAWCNRYPELNHNEMIGWTEQPVQKPYAVLELRSNLEHERVQKRFEVTERMLSGKRPAPIIIKPEGDLMILQLLWAIVLGDFVSIYLAILNGVNPTPVELVEKFKAALNE
jgi:glucose/mannose-6-phosphate isomerase